MLESAADRMDRRRTGAPPVHAGILLHALSAPVDGICGQDARCGRGYADIGITGWVAGRWFFS